MNIIGTGRVIRLKHLQTHFSNWQDKSLHRSNGEPHGSDSAHKQSDSASEFSGTKRPETLSGNKTLDAADPLTNNIHSNTDRINLIKNQSDHERKIITDTLHSNNGNITKTAMALGISRQLLYYKIKKFKINRGKKSN